MRLRMTIKTLAVTTTLLAGAFVVAVPRNPLPDPPGERSVGTTTVVVGPPDRRLPVQVWYPTEATSGTRAPVIPGAAQIAGALAEGTPLPEFALKPAGALQANAFADAPPAPGEWPVVILVHGWLGMRWVHSDIAEALASRGHVVIAADHVGGAIAAPYPDGSVARLDEALLPPEGHPEYWQRAEALVNLYADDVILLLDEMPAALAGAGIGNGGFTAIPAIGHSTGGGALVRAAQQDDRIAGIVGLDPWVEPIGPDVEAAAPLVAIRSAAWEGNTNDEVLLRMDLADTRVLPGTAHRDFTAIGWLSPVIRATGMVWAHPERVLAATLEGFDTVEEQITSRR